MILGDVIKFLEERDPNQEVRHGFGMADSYRGYYDEVAFTPKENTTIGEMLKEARAALGATYQGYKGGNYTMTAYTDCHLAAYGECGDDLSELSLKYMCDGPEECPSCSALRDRLTLLEKLMQESIDNCPCKRENITPGCCRCETFRAALKG